MGEDKNSQNQVLKVIINTLFGIDPWELLHILYSFCACLKTLKCSEIMIDAEINKDEHQLLFSYLLDKLVMGKLSPKCNMNIWRLWWCL